MKLHPVVEKSKDVRKAVARQSAGPRAAKVGPKVAPKIASIAQAKHQRVAEMIGQLRKDAEALSANADVLLSRLS